MSRSTKKAITKDKAPTPYYWRIIRSAIKNTIKSCKNWEDLEIPNPKSIYNDYDYCDWIDKTEYCNRITNLYSYEDLLNDRKIYRRK